MESFSDQLDPNISLTLVELKERYRAQTLIDDFSLLMKVPDLRGLGS